MSRSGRAVGNISNPTRSTSKRYHVPTITNNLAANLTRLAQPTPGHIMDFADSGGAQISSITYSAWTGANETGANSVANAVISSGTGVGNSYTADWGVNFGLLSHGTNYITVRVWDWAASSDTRKDAFRILKDTQVPGDITALTAQAGQ